MIQALLLGLIAFFGKCDLALGTSMLSKPIVLGPLVGLVLGDLEQGIIIGGTLELVFIGAQSVGAFIPPNVIVGGVLGTAFAITIGKGPEVAVTLAYPIALLAVVFDNLIFTLVRPLLANWADRFAEKGNAKAICRIHMGAGFLTCTILAVLVICGYSLGSAQVETFLNAIPKVITDGLTIATGLLPAVGFAMLAQMVMNKKVVPFFFFGFLLSAYISIPVVGIALFGLLVALVLVGFNNSESQSRNIATEGGDDDDF